MASQNGINNKVTDNDFTVNNQDCGATAFISVTNDCTDASSDALFQAVSASATAGDPAINFEVNSVTDWALGIDNSVTSPAADPFVISANSALGTTNVMTIQTAGEMNLPLQPCFSAYVSSTVTNVTGDGTFYDILYNTEVVDVGGNYNTSTGIFTAPIAGNYLFTFSALLQQMTTAMTAGFTLITSAGVNYALSDNAGAFTGNNAYGTSWIVNLDAADTAKIQVGVSMGTKVVDVYGGAGDARNTFAGQLIS